MTPVENGDSMPTSEAEGNVSCPVDNDGREVIHLCPPDGSGLMPCCNRTPFEVPRWHRVTAARAQVTCQPAAKGVGEVDLRLFVALVCLGILTLVIAGVVMTYAA